MRVTVADDSGLYRDLVAQTLRAEGHTVSTAGSATELLSVVEATRPEVVLADIRMPPTYTDDGLRAAVQIRERHPGIGVVLLSNHRTVAYAMQVVQTLRDRAGYLLKERATGARELLDTLERVAAGGLVIDPDIVSPDPGGPVSADNARVRAVLTYLRHSGRLQPS